jgi:hypothetical protein
VAPVDCIPDYRHLSAAISCSGLVPASPAMTRFSLSDKTGFRQLSHSVEIAGISLPLHGPPSYSASFASKLNQLWITDSGEIFSMFDIICCCSVSITAICIGTTSGSPINCRASRSVQSISTLTFLYRSRSARDRRPRMRCIGAGTMRRYSSAPSMCWRWMARISAPSLCPCERPIWRASLHGGRMASSSATSSRARSGLMPYVDRERPRRSVGRARPGDRLEAIARLRVDGRTLIINKDSL